MSHIWDDDTDDSAHFYDWDKHRAEQAVKPAKAHWGFWTEARVAVLTRLWNTTGKSASEIGQEMGCTRLAVIGKARRLKLAERTSEHWRVLGYVKGAGRDRCVKFRRAA